MSVKRGVLLGNSRGASCLDIPVLQNNTQMHSSRGCYYFSCLETVSVLCLLYLESWGAWDKSPNTPIRPKVSITGCALGLWPFDLLNPDPWPMPMDRWHLATQKKGRHFFFPIRSKEHQTIHTGQTTWFCNLWRCALTPHLHFWCLFFPLVVDSRDIDHLLKQTEHAPLQAAHFLPQTDPHL